MLFFVLAILPYHWVSDGILSHEHGAVEVELPAGLFIGNTGLYADTSGTSPLAGMVAMATCASVGVLRM